MTFSKNILFAILFTATTACANDHTPKISSGVCINELAVSGAAQWDGCDWIELYNDDAMAVQLKGWTVQPVNGGKESMAQLDSLTIPAKGYLVLKQKRHFGFDLGNSNDGVLLKKEGQTVNEVRYTTDLTNKTLGRVQDGAGDNEIAFNDEAQDWTAYPADDATIGGSNNTITFIYTSDPHYGTTRTFRGQKYVNATVVNAEMINQMNHLPEMNLPNDGGVNAGKRMQIDYVIQTGDITNRTSDKYNYPTSKYTMAQFDYDYYIRLNLQNVKGEKPEKLLSPGNHDVSNLIGHEYIPTDSIDGTVMVEIYNRMMNPAVPKTTATYDYENDKVNYIRTIGGIQFVFVNMWPDQPNRDWMASAMNPALPALIFTHDQPDVEAKHLIDPAHVEGTPYDFSNRFEFLIAEKADAGTDRNGPTDTQQRGFAQFIKANPNIKAYFHGNYNFNEFYTYRGPDKDIALPTIRVDSSMKGARTSDDESKLSFQVVSINRHTGMMTVREVLWNSTSAADAPVIFGSHFTLKL